MRQIAYFSTSAGVQSRTIVHDILVKSRRDNRAAEISGMLIAGGNRYLQVIEGPEHEIGELYSRILADDRHFSVTTLVDRAVSERSFEGWAMSFRSEPTLGHFASFREVAEQLYLHSPSPAARAQVRCLIGAFATSTHPFAATKPTAWPIALSA